MSQSNEGKRKSRYSSSKTVIVTQHGKHGECISKINFKHHVIRNCIKMDIIYLYMNMKIGVI